MSFGKELIKSAKEALAIAEGKAEPTGAFIPEKVNVDRNAGRSCC